MMTAVEAPASQLAGGPADQDPLAAFWDFSLENLADGIAGRQEMPNNPLAPPQFPKRLRARPVPLSRPGRLGTGRPTLGESLDDGCDERTWSTLLAHANGLIRYEPMPNPQSRALHRTVASPRCLFPTQLHLALRAPSCAPLRPGLYTHDPAHHALIPLRQGDGADGGKGAGDLVSYLVGLVGAEEAGDGAGDLGGDVDDVVGVAVLTSRFWQTAFVYRDYAYRLCSQEAGLVTGSLTVVAAALGLSADVHHLFPDGELTRLLGLTPGEEAPYAVVVLRDGRGRGARSPVPRPTAAPVPLPPPEDAARPVAVHCPRLVAMERAVVWEETAGVDWSEGATEPAPVPETVGPPVDCTPAGEPDLDALVIARNSGPGFFAPLRRPLPRTTLHELFRFAAQHGMSSGLDTGTGAAADTGIGTDLTHDTFSPSAAPLRIYTQLRTVEGVEPGSYRLADDGRSLLRHRHQPPVGPEVGGWLQPHYADVNAVVYVIGDRTWADRRFGTRGYRILNALAGEAAHRICLGAAGCRAAARITNSYHADAVRAQFDLADRRHVPLFQISVARSRPGPNLMSRIHG
ncbi:hypothetical protein ACIQU6_23755 [Streptomyces sp. NPDC090442]|uniref:hypothetical protein n=1 Tax=Streptomyces sp. NPDC090442 TaxID=3365962 RepID=UPI0037F64A28